MKPIPAAGACVVSGSFGRIRGFRPERYKPPQDLIEFLRADGLGEVAIHPRRQASLLVTFHRVRGQCDDGPVPSGTG